jgi:hypothetical protein
LIREWRLLERETDGRHGPEKPFPKIFEIQTSFAERNAHEIVRYICGWTLS